MGRARLALGAFVLLAAAAPANAATVTRTFPIDPRGLPYGDGTVAFTAAAGEANQVQIRLAADGAITLSDVNLLESRATGCEQLDPRTVRCTRGTLVVQLGDGDDTARVEDARTARESNLPITIEAGAGADALTGGPLAETFLDGGAGEADRFTGGGGDDRVSYAGRAAPVRVVLGAPNEDVFDGIASVTGGSGDDVLIGDGRANGLSGGPGDDRVEGRGGDDDLRGDGGDDRLLGGAGDDALAGDSYTSETGRDTLDGGPGDDVLDLSAADDETVSVAGPTYDPEHDGRRDLARCGAGTDAIAYRERRDVARSCEAIAIDGETAVAHRLKRVSRTQLRLWVVRGSVGGRVYVVPRRGRAVRLTRAVRVEGGRSRLPLTAAGRDYLRRSRAVRIVIPSLGVEIDATVTR